MLDIIKKPPGDDFDYQFKQFREVVPRNNSFDPVTKFVYAFDHWGDLFAVASRESSKVDFYYNGQRISSYNDPSDTVNGIDITFDETYILFGKNDLRGISNDLTSRMCMSESDSKKGFVFQNIFYQKIKNHCQIFNSFGLLKTFMLVAHGHLISLFSVTKQKWIKHFAFDHEIELIFRQKDEHDEFDLYVLLKDGTIHVINQRNNKNPDVDEFTIDETCGF
jgi:hypothetical protein